MPAASSVSVSYACFGRRHSHFSCASSDTPGRAALTARIASRKWWPHTKPCQKSAQQRCAIDFKSKVFKHVVNLQARKKVLEVLMADRNKWLEPLEAHVSQILPDSIDTKTQAPSRQLAGDVQAKCAKRLVGNAAAIRGRSVKTQRRKPQRR